jgi:hypothetical protein
VTKWKRFCRQSEREGERDRGDERDGLFNLDYDVNELKLLRLNEGSFHHDLCVNVSEQESRVKYTHYISD